MIGLLIQDNAFEQDIRELLMSFYPGEIYAHEVKDGVAFYVESRLRDGEVRLLMWDGGTDVPAAGGSFAAGRGAVSYTHLGDLRHLGADCRCVFLYCDLPDHAPPAQAPGGYRRTESAGRSL